MRLKLCIIQEYMLLCHWFPEGTVNRSPPRPPTLIDDDGARRFCSVPAKIAFRHIESAFNKSPVLFSNFFLLTTAKPL